MFSDQNARGQWQADELLACEGGSELLACKGGSPKSIFSTDLRAQLDRHKKSKAVLPPINDNRGPCCTIAGAGCSRDSLLEVGDETMSRVTGEYSLNLPQEKPKDGFIAPGRIQQASKTFSVEFCMLSRRGGAKKPNQVFELP